MIPRLTIYQRIVALTAAAILLSLGAMMIVTFRGPPPVSRPLDIEDVAGLLSDRPVHGWRIERGSATLPQPRPGEEDNPALAGEVALKAGLPLTAIRLFTPSPPPGLMAPGDMGPGDMGPPPEGMDHPPGRMLHDSFTLAIQQGQHWRILHGEAQPAILRWYAVTLCLMLAVFVILMIPVRRMARTIGDPIARLAQAAEEHGGGPSRLPDSGDAPPEVRALVTAMEGLQQRIRDQERDRAAMLRAIAHDLRTPMTRLSFRVDRLPDNQRERAQADIAEMQGMITAILDFMDGRGATRLALVEAASLIEALAEGYEEQGAAVSLASAARLVVLADAALLRRAAQNIIDNALRYGGGARIALGSDGHNALLSVDDDGPGIPPAEIARATEPFWRGEASRARATGGAGLGLAIVAEAAAAMNGTLAIVNRPEGGLRVTLALPLAG
ncbi:MAG TPA: ATP-binding protein [Sphingobium sp.]|uniref:ATP-binding protein n=1 Tax=Sphingobium sp. TaxID=1912891 RepID=UPI002ED5521C